MVLSDKELVIGLLDKEEKFINDFVQQYSGLLYKSCSSILSNKKLVEEAVQDSFLKIFKSVDKFDSRSSLKTWMYTIAHRTAIDYHRRIKRNYNLDEVYNVQSNWRADQALEISETKNQVKKLIGHLNKEDQKLISLFYIEELSMKEISQITGLSLSNIKIKMFRSRKELSKHVHKYFLKYDT